MCALTGSSSARVVPARTAFSTVLAVGADSQHAESRMYFFLERKARSPLMTQAAFPISPRLLHAPPDILLILWPLFFVAATRQDPHLKPRTFKKSVVRGIERTAGITKAIARPGPIVRSGSVEIGDTSRGLDDFREERSAWEPPAFERQAHA